MNHKVPNTKPSVGFLKLASLPKHFGISGLSATEIKNDIREMQKRLSSCADSGTDSSVDSDEVIASNYPVKPRRDLKLVDTQNVAKSSSKDNNSNSFEIDEALYIIKDIKKTKPDLYIKEKKREEFESMSQSYNRALAYEKGKFSEAKKQEESYLKLLQGCFQRSIRLHTVYSRHLSMVHYLFKALQKRKYAESLLESELQRIKTLVELNKSNKLMPDVKFLKIHLNRSNSDILVFVGQSVNTPYGEGEIHTLKPIDRIIVLKLCFGLLYVHFNTFVRWGSKIGNLDPYSDWSIHHFWESDIQKMISISTGHLSIIQNLLDANGMTDDDDNTDKEEDSIEESDSNENSLSNETLEEATKHPSSQSGDNGLIKNSSTQSMDAESSTESHQDGEPFMLDQNLFPLKPSSYDPTERKTLLQIAKQKSNKNISEKLLSEVLPLAYGASSAVAITDFLRNIQPHRRSVDQLLGQDLSELVEYDASSFEFPGDKEDFDVQNTRTMTWFGNMDELRSALKRQGDFIRDLESKYYRNVLKLENLRGKCSRFTTDTSTIRMGMFTRRTRHRNILYSSGVTNEPESLKEASSAIPGPMLPSDTKVSSGIDVLLDAEAKSQDNSMRITRQKAQLKDEQQSPAQLANSQNGNTKNASGDKRKLIDADIESNSRGKVTNGSANDSVNGDVMTGKSTKKRPAKRRRL